MQVTSSASYYAGLSAIQAGLKQIDQAANTVATQNTVNSLTSQSTPEQAKRLLSVNDSSQSDYAASAVQAVQGKLQVEAGAKVEKAADRNLGTLIDTFA